MGATTREARGLWEPDGLGGGCRDGLYKPVSWRGSQPGEEEGQGIKGNTVAQGMEV